MYHQYYGVNKAVKETIKAVSPEGDGENWYFLAYTRKWKGAFLWYFIPERLFVKKL